MIMGGDNPATNTTELIDLSPAGAQISTACPIYAPCWVPGPNMVQARVEMEATILPNGKVLVDGGSAHDEEASTASLKAEIYDPATNSFSSAGSNAFPRLYHNVQLLLPDGTVAITGGNPEQGVFENHIEIYQPAYLFNSDGTLATRPKIGTGTPASITYGGSFNVPTQDASSYRIRRSDEARLGHPFVRHGPALCRVQLHRRFRKSHSVRSAEFKHRASRILHAVPGEQSRDTFDCELGAGFGSGGSNRKRPVPSGTDTYAALHRPEEARN